MDNVSVWFWVLISVITLVSTIILGATPALVTGTVCGKLMRGLTIRRGLSLSLWVVIPAVVISIANIYVSSITWSSVLSWSTIIASILATIILCRRRALSNR